ncbi:MAG TPA: response regulator [Polyangiaceae bacterium]|nr:response regulator [Polyangiaceae bacterium]
MARVLHVDDDPTLRRAIQRLFRRSGLRVVSVASAAEAEALLECEDFDLAVIDHQIGTDDGLELIERLAGSRSELVIILLSGSITRLVEQRACELGVARCLSKALPASQIVGEVAALAGMSGIVSIAPRVVRATGS